VRPAGSQPLEGLRVLVTGASSGLGGLTSLMLAFAGCRVVGTGRSFARAPARLVLEAAIELDLLERAAPAEVVGTAATTLGGLDVVISNAGAGWAGPYESMSEADLDEQLALNLRAPMQVARTAAPYLRESHGQLVLVSSIAGVVGVAGEVAYSSAKGGVARLADGLREEWYPDVVVSLVAPAAIDTPFFARRNRPYTRTWPHPIPTQKAAAAVVRAVERRPAEVYVPYWVALVPRLRGALPGTYRHLARLFRDTGSAGR